MNHFIDDMKKYYSYAKYSAKAELKAEVAGSYLNWVWWILRLFLALSLVQEKSILLLLFILDWQYGHFLIKI